jgi:hypothetical protein
VAQEEYKEDAEYVEIDKPHGKTDIYYLLRKLAEGNPGFIGQRYPDTFSCTLYIDVVQIPIS